MVSFLSEAWLWRVHETTFLRNLEVEKNQWRSVGTLFVSFLLAPPHCPAMDSMGNGEGAASAQDAIPSGCVCGSQALLAACFIAMDKSLSATLNLLVEEIRQLPKTARRDSCARCANLQYRFKPFGRESTLLCLNSSSLNSLRTKTLWEATEARK